MSLPIVVLIAVDDWPVSLAVALLATPASDRRRPPIARPREVRPGASVRIGGGLVAGVVVRRLLGVGRARARGRRGDLGGDRVVAAT